MIKSCPSYADLSSPLHKGPTHPEPKHRIRLLWDMSQHLLIHSQNLRQSLLLPPPLSRIWGSHPTLGHRDRVLAASLQPQLGPVQTTPPLLLSWVLTAPPFCLSPHCSEFLEVPTKFSSNSSYFFSPQHKGKIYTISLVRYHVRCGNRPLNRNLSVKTDYNYGGKQYRMLLKEVCYLNNAIILSSFLYFQ